MKVEEELRPDPDQILLGIKKEEEKKHSGKLKIFLGVAAGVGKTYAMLRSANSLKKNGVDVVIGFVETHKRKETEEQLGDLEVLPRKNISYKGKFIEEFNIDLALKRKPQVMIVDELPHTNTSGSRNNKRYLDIMELLHAGIDVYTAVNIQHIESKNHTVREITGVLVRETVPDSFLDLADEIVVIDLPPEDLLKRLKDGLIYSSDRAFAAEKNFFQRGNLTALRELSLRAAAERVDKDLREYRSAHHIQEIWKGGHRLLVAIFASPYAENMIRSTRQLSDTLNASWIGVYIDDGGIKSEEEKTLLAKNINLVQELGGEVITSKDEKIAEGLLRIARQNNVTQIIVGKSARRWWQVILTGGSLVNRLMRLSGDIDVFSISNVDKKNKGKKKLIFKNSLELGKTGNELGVMSVIVLLSWFLAGALSQFMGYLPIGFIFLLVVCLSGLYLTQLSIFILATLFAFIHNFFFIPPLYTLSIDNAEDFMMLFLFFSSATVMGHLTSRLRTREKNLALREEKALAAYHLTKSLSACKGIQDVLQVGANYLEKIFSYQVIVLCKHEDKNSYSGSWGISYRYKKEKAVIDWVLMHRQHAGRFTKTLSAVSGYYIPLIGKEKVYGVIGINAEKIQYLDAEEISLLENFSAHIASTLEREIFHEQAKKLDVIEKSHKLYRTLLDSVSHELKTPLSAIKGCASALLDPLINKDQTTTCDLSQEILLGSSRLQRVVENLLDMSRIDSGLIKPKVVSYSLNDLVHSAMRKFHLEFPERYINFHGKSFDKEVLCDPNLCEQVLINILHNAHMYSPNDKSIEITTEEENFFAKISIRDYGPGIKNCNEGIIFEKFYRADPHYTGGLGLGLSIVKSFMELQKGKIIAQNVKEGGALFSLFLPLEKSL